MDSGQARRWDSPCRIFVPGLLSDPDCDDAPIILFGAHWFLPGVPPDRCLLPVQHDPAGHDIHIPAVVGGVGLRAGGSQVSWAGPVGVFEGAVEAAEVAESAVKGDRRDGPAGEAGVEEFTA